MAARGLPSRVAASCSPCGGVAVMPALFTIPVLLKSLRCKIVVEPRSAPAFANQ
jgi:hypothetical protein